MQQIRASGLCKGGSLAAIVRCTVSEVEGQPIASAARDEVRPWASFKILWARQARPRSLATFSTPRKRN